LNLLFCYIILADD